VTVANNGRLAMEAFAQQPFDLVFMDMQMPEMDGKQATKAILQYQKETGIRVPIVAMTAHAMVGDREKCLAAGMDDYISKPISLDELGVVIARNSTSAPASSEAATPAASPGRAQPPGDAVPEPAAATPAHQTNISINGDELLRRFGGNKKLLRRLVDMFPEESLKVMAALKEARAAQKAADVELNPHTLKGMCKTFGESPAAEIAYELEKIASAGGLGTDVEASRLETELDRVVKSVKSFQASLGDALGGKAWLHGSMREKSAWIMRTGPVPAS
jgi:two-component system, sensor histidine kinase and response regulator